MGTIWSRHIVQDYPTQGVRIPYQEYLQAGRSAETIACRIPPNALLNLSYVAEHVSDDVAVSVLERAIQSVERVREDGFVPGTGSVRKGGTRRMAMLIS
jgi:exodeoxyribonuclease V alpha subunit